jgi:phenylacetate-coenzyme A ligase PaaK-like adenylate-forming protein
MDFVNSFKEGLFNISDRNFNEKAMELFNFQAENNPFYKTYLELLKVNPSSITDITQIPFMPIDFFKTHIVITGGPSYDTIFLSSGTTGQERSKHYVTDLPFYELVTVKIFNFFYGELKDHIILALVPSYLENKNSSLIYMINGFIKKSGSELSGFVLGEMNSLKIRLDECRKRSKKIILFGVSYALLDLAEQFPIDLSDVIVIETGGMKGRRKEILKNELHRILTDKLSLTKVHSEYGMTELLSQAYSAGKGRFKCPPWMKILIREVNDPFLISNEINHGGINIIDLANVNSCAFIETQDLGSASKDGSFEVRGRLDNSDLRGCNLMYIP